jgi:purine nucleoside phosphorylase
VSAGEEITGFRRPDLPGFGRAASRISQLRHDDVDADVGTDVDIVFRERRGHRPPPEKLSYRETAMRRY